MQGKQWFAVGSQTPGDSVSYHYDDQGRLDSYSDARGTTSYSFDLDGRTTQIASPEGTLNYGYDAATGRHARTWTAYSDIGYGYDELGRLETVSVAKRDGVTLGAQEVTTYQYNAVGAVAQVTHGNGTTTDNSYDSLNRLADVTHKTSGGAVIADYAYTRLADGKISRVVESNASGQVSQTDYEYDELGRLAHGAYDGVAAGSDYTIDYTLDLVGNRLAKETTFENSDVQLVNSAYNLRDWLTSEETRLNGNLSDTASYGYDANGSLTTRSSTSGDSATYTWDLRNRLASASVTTGGQTNVSSYVYDDSGIEVRRTENGTTRLLLVDSLNPTGYAQVIEELASGLLVASYVYGLEPLSQSQNGQISHYLMDGHSGVRQLLDAAGAVLNAYRFDAFGTLLSQTGAAVNPVLYRGERFDPVLGQYYLRARFYDAARGRFTAVDPFFGRLIDPLSLHRYQYTAGDPISRVDPSGQDPAIFGIWRRARGLSPDSVSAAERDPRWWPILIWIGVTLGISFSLVCLGALATFGGGGGPQWDINGDYPHVWTDSQRQRERWNACFTAGTPILTPEGNKPIEQFEAGDLVLTRDENDPEGDVHTKIVQEVFVSDGYVLELYVASRVIRTTSEHPFFVLDKGWLPASRLAVGDLLLTADGGQVTVDRVVQTEEYVRVYNLRIADFHTYFVGCAQWGFAVWAHNTCVPLFKAPLRGRGFKQFTAGYDATDFTIPPAQGGDNRIYFAKDRWIADSYAVHGPYSDGVIEILVDQGQYDNNLRKYEKVYIGTNVHTGKTETGTELPLPESVFYILNASTRIWHTP